MTRLTQRDRAMAVASHADRLQADLLSINAMLLHYRESSDQLEELRECGDVGVRQLEAISKRIDSLGQTDGLRNYQVSEEEYEQLERAETLRSRMMETLGRLQQADQLATGRKPGR